LIARLNTGGPALHTVLLTRGLNDRRFRTRLVTGTVGAEEGDMVYVARAEGVTPTVLPELSQRVSPWTHARAFWRVYQLLRAEQPDIVHTHTAKAGVVGRIAALAYNAGRRLSRRPRASLVHTFHGHVFHGYFSPWKSKLLVVMERTLASRTDAVVTVAESVRRDLVDVYRVCPADKVHVVPLGLNLEWTARLERTRGDVRRGLGLSPAVCLVGIVGRLTAVKNHALFLAAASRMTREAHFAVIGDGELRADVERRAAAPDLRGRVSLLGWQKDPARIYADLDIVCLTSRNEGTPAALIEAMAARRPFVATRVGGVADLMVGRARREAAGFDVFANGILVAPADPEQLTAALDFLAGRPELRAAMGAAGHAFAIERFSRTRLIDAVAQLYTTLLGSVNGGR
jgi:glycosyltransferase involved in cell wall biosynthesis